MHKISNLFKTLMIIFALGAVVAGCERREADQSGAQSSGATSSPGSESRSGGGSSSGATGATGAYGGSGSAGRAIDDSVITTKAKSALLADTTVKGTDIDVETDRGIVTLSGMVDNERQRDRAASIVRGIDGVKSVENKMTVKQ